MKDLVGRVIRELPETDKNRYDIAYQRGRAQVRSIFVLGGLVAGLGGGIAGMFLLDPERGGARRSRLLERLRDLGAQAASSIPRSGLGRRGSHASSHTRR